MRCLAPTFMRVDNVVFVIVMLLSLVEVASARFRARRVMNLDGTSVAFVSVWLLTLSCLPPLRCFVVVFFLPMRHFGHCFLWQRCAPAERAVWFRAVYYPGDVRLARSNPHCWAHI